MSRNDYKIFISQLIQFIFRVLFLTSVCLFFVEFYKTGFVTNYIPFNAFLIFTLIFGIFSLHFTSTSPTKKYYFVFILGTILISIFVGFVLFTILPDDGFSFYAVIPWAGGTGVFLSLYLLRLKV